ncbi:hypothetical protein PIB30_021744 [Stylosanthes scabra]|uniref:2-oxoadipate dioxygenase/decarboxylase n=1 Tax=Stylosanthes scabra TaxID=79078 RepID=A0ABU6T988_9FABA|nr:hypothetical protein [Stylosanthes scabra]
MFTATKSSTTTFFSLQRAATATAESASSKPKLFNLVSMKEPRSPLYKGLGLINPHRSLSVSCSSRSHEQNGSFHKSSIQGGEAFLRGVLESMQSVYLNRNPTAKAILELVHSVENNSLCYDHLAFRTFGVNGYGIDSMASFFMDYGYTPREELRFPAKKLRALWFSPPADSQDGGGSGIKGPLPRIFISELIVDQMSSQTQEIIRKYTASSGNGNKYAALASSLGLLTWENPSHSEFQQLARLNSEGGVLKVSPDGLLLQSSTVADSISFQFSDGVTESVPCSYIEFAERLVLPQYKDLPATEVKEFHRRDGFEVGNADKIFESTSKEQLSRVGS